MLERILMTADCVGGAWSHALTLSRALGVRVILATLGPAPSRSQRAEAEGLVELHVGEFKLEWMQNPWDDVARSGEWLLALAEKVRPDLVHLNGYAHAALPFAVPKLVVGHSDVLSWYRAVRHFDAPPSWERYRCEITRGLQSADDVIAPTRTMLQSLARDYGPFRRSAVIHDARDAGRYSPQRKLPIVLGAGRMWDDARNLRTLESAAPRLSWPVEIAASLSPEELADRYAKAAIYALPARYEPSALGVLEAALSGCALVLGDLENLRELWDGAAEFVPPDDVDALVKVIETLIDDGPRRGVLAHQARSRALALSPQKQAEEYLARYRALLGREDALCAE
jgi:glycosyltransferase involved in cell wall biosynthesis